MSWDNKKMEREHKNIKKSVITFFNISHPDNKKGNMDTWRKMLSLVLTLDLPCPLLKMLTSEKALPIEELSVINAQPEKKKNVTLMDGRFVNTKR